MNQDQQQSSEKRAEEALKDANQKLEGKDSQEDVTGNDLPSTEEAVEQIKGSDADADQLTGEEDQNSSDEAAEQLKGSDADKA